MLTHTYIRGTNPKRPLVEPNALELWGLSKALGDGGMTGQWGQGHSHLASYRAWN